MPDLSQVDRLTRLFDVSASGMLVLDAEGHIQCCNRAAGVLFGQTAESLQGASFPPDGWELRHHADPVSAEEATSALDSLLCGAPIQGLAIWLYNQKTDTGHWLSVNAAPERNPATEKIAEYYVTLQVQNRQKELERFLRESRYFIKSVVDATPEIFYIHELENRKTIFINRNVLSELEYTPAEILALGSEFMSELLHPEDLQRLPERLARWETAVDDQILETEYRLRDKAGEWHWFLARDKVYKRNHAGIVTHVVGSVRDTTGHRETQYQLDLNEQRLALALEATSGGLWDYNLVEDSVYFSPLWYTMLGYEPGEFPGSAYTWRLLVHPEDFSRVENTFMRFIKEGDDEVNTEFRLRMRDGSWCWVSGHGRVVERDERGYVTRVAGTHLDISERKARELQLLREHEALEQSLDGVGILDIEGRFEYVNRALCNFIGYTPEELLGQHLRIVHTKEQFYDEIAPIIERVTESGHFEGRCHYTHKNGLPIPARLAVSTIRDTTGNVVGTVAIVHDISRQAQLEEELRQAQKLKALGQFAGSIAHDFNNLLSPILGFAEMLSTEIAPTDMRHQRVIQITSAAKKARSITRQLLAFSRKQTLRVEVMCINRMVKELRLLLVQTLRSEVALVVDLDPSERVVIRGDGAQLEMVVMNLVINAQDAMPNGGTLTIRTRLRHRDALPAEVRGKIASTHIASIHVEDEGEGMRPEILTQIFEPFFTTKAADKGTGLGLASVQGIIEQHGGCMLVESTEGQGSTFSAFIPGDVAPDPANNEPILNQSPEACHGHILVVDDEGMVRDLVGQMLRRAGYTVTCADGGEACLALIARDQPSFDLALLDVMMPKMNGVELGKQIQVALPGTPMLFMSGYTDENLARYIEGKAEFHLLRKPFSNTELLEKVRDLIRNPV